MKIVFVCIVKFILIFFIISLFLKKLVSYYVISSEESELIYNYKQIEPYFFHVSIIIGLVFGLITGLIKYDTEEQKKINLKYEESKKESYYAEILRNENEDILSQISCINDEIDKKVLVYHNSDDVSAFFVIESEMNSLIYQMEAIIDHIYK